MKKTNSTEYISPAMWINDARAYGYNIKYPKGGEALAIAPLFQGTKNFVAGQFSINQDAGYLLHA